MEYNPEGIFKITKNFTDKVNINWIELLDTYYNISSPFPYKY